jgi:hypothetical protein
LLTAAGPLPLLRVTLDVTPDWVRVMVRVRVRVRVTLDVTCVAIPIWVCGVCVCVCGEGGVSKRACQQAYSDPGGVRGVHMLSQL